MTWSISIGGYVIKGPYDTLEEAKEAMKGWPKIFYIPSLDQMVETIDLDILREDEYRVMYRCEPF